MEQSGIGRVKWIVIFSLALLSSLVLFWMSNRHGIPSGPSTTVNALTVQAKLPGTNWHVVQAVPTPGPDVDLYDGTERVALWETDDKSIFFRVALGPDQPEMGELDDQVSQQTTGDLFVGYRGLQEEAVSPGANAYHKVEHMFQTVTATDSYFFVAAGATNDAWKKGASDTVYAILSSVSFPQR